MRLLPALALALAAALASPARAEQHRLLFTGDVMLSREVAREIAARPGISPWAGFETLFRGADWVAGNFEGAVGDPGDCPPDANDRNPCFAVAPQLVGMLRQAGFHAMTIENNHAGDLGSAGRRATRDALRRSGLAVLDYDEAPGFLRLGSRTLAIVPVSLVAGRDGRRETVPSRELARKLALGRALADWVVVLVHWGTELADWPNPDQVRAADWLVEAGADLILGAHPHVVQEPACVRGRPVFYSLGNHLFDQKYPLSKQGLIADCRIADGALACGGLRTETPRGSAFPRPAGATAEPAQCRAPAGAPLMVGDIRLTLRAEPGAYVAGEILLQGRGGGRARWTGQRQRPLRLAAVRFDGVPHLFAVERHPSSIDDEVGPRPYVYAVTAQGLVAKWRGSALAWPLVDAVPLPDGDSDLLCALHRSDSFVMLSPQSTGLRTAAYRWNGFGFSGITEPGAVARCAAAFETPPR